MDTSQERSQGIKGSERMRSLPLMLIIFQSRKVASDLSRLKLFSAAYEFDQGDAVIARAICTKFYTRTLYP